MMPARAGQVVSVPVGAGVVIMLAVRVLVSRSTLSAFIFVACYSGDRWGNDAAGKGRGDRWSAGTKDRDWAGGPLPGMGDPADLSKKPADRWEGACLLATNITKHCMHAHVVCMALSIIS